MATRASAPPPDASPLHGTEQGLPPVRIDARCHPLPPIPASLPLSSPLTAQKTSDAAAGEGTPLDLLEERATVNDAALDPRLGISWGEPAVSLPPRLSSVQLAEMRLMAQTRCLEALYRLGDMEEEELDRRLAELGKQPAPLSTPAHSATAGDGLPQRQNAPVGMAVPCDRGVRSINCTITPVSP